MRITKYEHATLTIVDNDGTLIVDPGGFTRSLDWSTKADAVVVTHEHPDHWSADALDRILEANPGIPIFGPAGFAQAASNYDVVTVAPGERVTVGPFTLQFFGGTHAVIHESIPVIDNVGVLVNDTFYYPGDSYAIPEGVHVKALAAPLGAPWLKIGDAMDFVLAVAPDTAFGSHDGTLSQAGLDMHHARLTWATEQHGGTYRALAPGDSLDV